MMLTLGYVGALLMGVSLGLMGAGGSILTVPIFVYLFKFPAASATGLSLFVVGVVSALGAWRYMRQHLVQSKLALVFSLPAVATVFWARRVLVPGIPEVLWILPGMPLSKNAFIMLLFALVMVLAAWGMIRKKSLVELGPRVAAPVLKMMLLGAVVGLVSGLVGAGGGFLIVPALVILGNLEMKSAVGTSLMVIAINSCVGFFGEMQTGVSVPWRFLLEFTALATGGMVLGAALAKKISSEKLKPAFGWFVLVMASVIVFQELTKSN